jgi:hypothetical protein
MFLRQIKDIYRGQVGTVSYTQSSTFAIVLAIVLVLIALASRRRRLGEPFGRRPAARVLLVVAVAIVLLCVLLATRHGG